MTIIYLFKTLQNAHFKDRLSSTHILGAAMCIANLRANGLDLAKNHLLKDHPLLQPE